MMRSLWTAASGMSSMMLQIDTISNNLANVNTTGFKRERVEFKSLLYETMQRANLDPVNMTGRPVNLQVGHGVRPAATTRMFTQGSFMRTDRPLDFAISGDGFFQVRRNFDEYYFTRDGAFHFMPLDDGSLILTTATGYPVIGMDGGEIIIPPGVAAGDMTVMEDGVIYIRDEDGFPADSGMQIALVQFSNPNGLEAAGNNVFVETIASGPPLFEADGETGRVSRLVQNFLEMSNVQIAEEMIGLIVTQRAFDLNSRAITTSDEMLQTANGLKR